MKWLISLFLASLLGNAASAQTPMCEKIEAACVLDAAWSAALVLPEEKRTRLTSAFLETASNSGDPALVEYWEARLQETAGQVETYPDFGWQKAEPLLQAGGTARLIQVAKDRAEPLNFGRADALLSAGKRLITDDASGSEALNDALLDLT